MRLDNGWVRAEAEAVDASGAETVCAEALAYPAALLRVGFEDDPLEKAAVAVTGGWGDSATVIARAGDALSPDSSDLSGTVQPEEAAEPIAPLSCGDEDFQRHVQRFDESAVALGERQQNGDAVVAMRSDSAVYERGDTVRVILRNVSERMLTTDNEHTYNLQVCTESGWQDVRGGDGPFPYTGDAVGHPPGEGFEWRFEFTGSGITESGYHDFEGCPGLPDGHYRFAYFGMIGDGALAVEFDLARQTSHSDPCSLLPTVADPEAGNRR